MPQSALLPFHVIVPAAGQGTRMGGDIPKQYMRIAGKTVLRHTLDQILSWPGLVSLHVIIDPRHAKLYDDTVTGLDLPPSIHGGKERSDSINNALSNISNVRNEDIILVHDAARPLIRWPEVARLLSALKIHPAATLTMPISDTIRRMDTNEDVARDQLYAVQTPQGFRYEDLKRAHDEADSSKIHTDDVALAHNIGIEAVCVKGARQNFKLTTLDDFDMAEKMLATIYETRTGLGFDVHAFDTVNTEKPLILCGVKIPHDFPLKGHSDADVGLHALTDAILGAIGDGDIGTHFPPSNQDFKDMDSAIFLRKAIELLHEKGGAIQNLDLTLICESPKIAPHREVMIARVAEIANLKANRISIKATTTEKLGFTGRGEGIAAQAIASVKIPVE